MKRVIMGAFIGMTFFLCAHRPASAEVEFCPATVAYQRAGLNQTLQHQADRGTTPPPPASLYGFELRAQGPRTITSATLAFDTNEGWFTATIARAQLAEKDRHYTGPSSTFVRRDYVSPVMYLRFPDAVTIRHAWVYGAAAIDDDTFGWQSKGAVQCAPPPEASPKQRSTSDFRQAYKLDPKDEDQIGMPEETSLVLAAQRSSALEQSDCALPFSNAATKRLTQARFPESMFRMISGPAVSTVQVAINPDGSLADAWIWGPSGYTAFDDEALRVAKNTTYTGARAYCRAVPGLYMFRVTFAPN